jgi:ribonuclease P protein component
MVERLTRPEDFNSVYKKGTLKFGRYVVITALQSDQSVTRVGYSVSKKIGNAVTRNRVKRRLREIVRGMARQIRPGYDIVIGAKRSSPRAAFSELEADLYRIMQGLGCLERNTGGEEVD